MTKYLGIIFLITLCLPAKAHKFYTSITDISYNEESKSIEIMIKLFVDDFEKAIEENYTQKLNLGKEKEIDDNNGLIKKYLKTHFEISIKDKDQELNYLGKETDRDYIWLYIEIPKVKSINDISIKNTLLTDVFPDQTNLINLETDSGIKSITLHKDFANYSF